ncbi:MAG: RNA polymerase sigma factor [Planctomycetota bacterium]|jgi:RNA polymerase sigma-70 factor (ECF subfamily)
MSGAEQTDMGGTGAAFLTTHWSLFEDIGRSEGGEARALIGLLLKQYWKPVYCYLRRRGFDNEEAKDLTQGFFHQVVLGRQLIEKADQAKGRFRNFLLTALNRYLLCVRHKERALKRIPKNKLVPLEAIDPNDLPHIPPELGPEDSFHQAWMTSLLEWVLEEVEARCRDDGKVIHWQVFCERVLEPILDDTRPPSLAETCQRYGIEDGITVSNMAVTVKRRLQKALRRHLRAVVTSEDEVTAELQDIVRFFPGMAHNQK